MKQYHLNWEQFKEEAGDLYPMDFESRYGEYSVHHGLKDSYIIWLEDGFYQLEMFHDYWCGTTVSTIGEEKVTDSEKLEKYLVKYKEVLDKFTVIVHELKK